jgi:LIM domain-binding protein 1
MLCIYMLQESDNLWWDAFATEFFEDEATLTLTFCLEDGPKRYSKCISDHIICLLTVQGWRGMLVRKEALYVHLKVFSVCFKNVHSNRSYECDPDTVNVFERGITLPGHCEVSLAATTPCRLELRTLFGSAASKLSFLCTALQEHKMLQSIMDHGFQYNLSPFLIVSGHSACLFFRHFILKSSSVSSHHLFRDLPL